MTQTRRQLDAVCNLRAGMEGCAQIDFHSVPSTRYQGSKRKLLPWIHRHVKNLEFDSVVDVFGGTGAVSYLLKRMGKAVTYNDLLHFNYIVGRAMIQNDGVTLSPDEIRALVEPVRSLNAQGTISRHFTGFYFTDYENRWLDKTITKIFEYFGKAPARSFKQNLALYALFQTCLAKRPFNLFHRRNLYLRTAHVDRTFGNKTTWDRSIRDTFRAFLNEANAMVFRGERKCRALNLEALQIPDGEYGLAYMDPPYLLKFAKNETADYRRVYHFLEGMSQYQQWPTLIDFTTKDRSLKIERENNWLSEKINSKLFDQLFDKFERSIIVVSYKRHGVPSVETIVRKLKRRNRRVRCCTTQYWYALNRQNGQAKWNREYLIIAE